MSDYEQPAASHKPLQTMAAGAGALIGGIAGLAAGVGVMVIPGVGPAIAVGPLAVALGSAGIGAAAGGFIASLTADQVVEARRHVEETPEVEREVKQTVPSAARVYVDGLEFDPRQGRFEDFENDYRADFTARNLPGHTYDQFSPAYRYGHTLASDPRFTSQDWLAVEDYARREWESENPGSWPQVKDAVRYAWQSHKFDRRDG